jgi:hypothetical protein
MWADKALRLYLALFDAQNDARLVPVNKVALTPMAALWTVPKSCLTFFGRLRLPWAGSTLPSGDVRSISACGRNWVAFCLVGVVQSENELWYLTK